MTTPNHILNRVLSYTPPLAELADCVTFTGADPVLPTRYRLGAAGAAAIAACGLAAANLWHLRTGRRQQISVDVHPAALALRAHQYLRVDGRPPNGLWSPISGFYATADKRWIQLHCNFPHHRDGVLRILECANDQQAVANAVATWDGQSLENVLARAGMVAALVRSREEWLAHPQGQAVSQLPLLEIERTVNSPPEPLPAGDRPLSGVRVLDLTRVIAGPVGGRTLAAHGADVLRVGGAHLPNIPPLVIDTGHGKRSAHIDLRRPAGVEQLQTLAKQADIFVQGYRPGTLAGRGLSPEALARLRPGIIYVTLSAYGHEGPWRNRRGYDSLVQSASGIVAEESAGQETPRHLPAQALDYISGYLLAFGAMAALARRTQEGGSYRVRVSLAQTGWWLHQQGRVDADDLPSTPSFESVQDMVTTSNSPFGRLHHLAPVAQLSETPAQWERPPGPLGNDEPAWV